MNQYFDSVVWDRKTHLKNNQTSVEIWKNDDLLGGPKHRIPRAKNWPPLCTNMQRSGCRRRLRKCSNCASVKGVHRRYVASWSAVDSHINIWRQERRERNRRHRAVHWSCWKLDTRCVSQATHSSLGSLLRWQENGRRLYFQPLEFLGLTGSCLDSGWN